MRRRYQGVSNIVRFNWHFYVLAGLCVLLLFWFAGSVGGHLIRWLLIVSAAGVVTSTCVSLLISHYIYDRSALYDFTWLNLFNKAEGTTIVNVHAGFDETSGILKNKFPAADLAVFDFYDRSKHTELSIERARKAYRPFPGTIHIATSQLPVANKGADVIFNIFALHEVRNSAERIGFLNEQHRALRDGGTLVVVEHLRDVPNFLAFNIGFFHFLPANEWRSNFQEAGFYVEHKLKITPFVTVFVLKKADGNTR